MEKIRFFVLEEPGLYILGILVSLTAVLLGFSAGQMANLLFWWFVICAVPIGLYMAFCNLIAFFIEKGISKETYPGWNRENRPSLQELAKTDPGEAQWMGELYDIIDQTSYQGGMTRLLFAIIPFASLIISAAFLRSFSFGSAWWKLILAFIFLGLGLISHSNKAKEKFFPKYLQP